MRTTWWINWLMTEIRPKLEYAKTVVTKSKVKYNESRGFWGKQQSSFRGKRLTIRLNGIKFIEQTLNRCEWSLRWHSPYCLRVAWRSIGWGGWWSETSLACKRRKYFHIHYNYKSFLHLSGPCQNCAFPKLSFTSGHKGAREANSPLISSVNILG